MQKRGSVVGEHTQDKYIKWFSELGKKDVIEVGGKGANLGEMYNLNFPVPPGFVITAASYKYFLEKTGLDKKIYEILSTIDIENTKELDQVSKKIKALIEMTEMPEDLGEEISENYEILSFDSDSYQNATQSALSILKMSHEEAFVAVRSSATAEDSAEASFAGQQETFLNIKGKTSVIKAVKDCFASLFSPRSIYYRAKKGFKHESVLIAVVVQKMLSPDKSGVIFSRDPVTHSSNIVVESVFGLGEGIVSGQITPDHYVVGRTLDILEKRISEKKIALARNSSGKTETFKLTPERSKSQVLKEYEIKTLAEYAIKLEEHYGLPQDIEFAIDSGKIYLVQTRPVTTLKEERKTEEKIDGKVLLEGQPASPGIGSGEVKVIYKLEDMEKIRKGDVLVTKMTNPDMVVAMQKSAAIITDEGGATSHAAIVSREMGIPCVVGTERATQVLKDGMIVTVDGFNAKIYEGKLDSLRERKVEVLPIEKTRTKIKVIVDLPDFAERAAKTGSKEVGLTRIEGIIAESGKHPYYFVKQGKTKEYEDLVYRGISKISEYFEELWIRTSDIRSDEFRNLEGSPHELELNPMLGMHGIRFGVKHLEILKSELKAIKRVSEKKKMGILLPQIISVEEVQKVKECLNEIGLNENLKLGVMVETPAAVQIIEELCQEQIDFISFGTNDLTQFTLAIDRGNEQVQYLYNELHPAMKKQISSVIKVCKKYSVETSICGQAGSNLEMVEFLVKEGIDSISTNADKAREVSLLVKEIEEKSPINQMKENFEEIEAEVEQKPVYKPQNEEYKEIKDETDVIDLQKDADLRKEQERERIEQERLKKLIDYQKEESLEGHDIEIGDDIFKKETPKEENEEPKEDVFLSIF